MNTNLKRTSKIEKNYKIISRNQSSPLLGEYITYKNSQTNKIVISIDMHFFDLKSLIKKIKDLKK